MSYYVLLSFWYRCFFCCWSVNSTKESSIVNVVMTVFHVIFFGVVIVACFANGNPKNLIKPKGLAPFGARGVLDGAAMVYVSYIGYDSVSTMAEEIRNPSKSLPIGIAGSVLIVSALYCLMALALCSMIPYDEVRVFSLSIYLERERDIYMTPSLFFCLT